jgi:hypothetical protein
VYLEPERKDCGDAAADQRKRDTVDAGSACTGGPLCEIRVMLVVVGSQDGRMEDQQGCL